MDMSEQQHTPGTLTVGLPAVESGFNWCDLESGDYIIGMAVADRGLDRKIADANARRLAACWNACRHFATTDLESIGVGPYMEVASGTGDNDGVRLIAIERVRQVTEKGWTAEHDDTHGDKSIAAAACAIVYDYGGGTHTTDLELADDSDAEWHERLAAHVLVKYEADPIRRLTIAGALIAAEIDRLRRAQSKAQTEPADAR